MPLGFWTVFVLIFWSMVVNGDWGCLPSVVHNERYSFLSRRISVFKVFHFTSTKCRHIKLSEWHPSYCYFPRDGVNIDVHSTEMQRLSDLGIRFPICLCMHMVILGSSDEYFVANEIFGCKRNILKWTWWYQRWSFLIQQTLSFCGIYKKAEEHAFGDQYSEHVFWCVEL